MSKWLTNRKIKNFNVLFRAFFLNFSKLKNMNDFKLDNMGYPWNPVRTVLAEDCVGLLQKGQRPRAILCFQQVADQMSREARSKLKNSIKRYRLPHKLFFSVANRSSQQQLLQNVANEMKDEANKILKSLNPDGENFAVIQIPEGATGFGYDRIFGPYLNDPNITEITIEEPYLGVDHQIKNLIRFCELVANNCPNLNRINLVTKEIGYHLHQQCFPQLEKTLANFNVTFNYRHELIHDRAIRFNNGYVFEIGFGLDYYKPPRGQWGVGSSDFNFRPCKKTTIKISYVRPP